MPPARERGMPATVSLGIVAAVAAADIACAASLSRRRRQAEPRDYSDRSGLPRPPAQMRGAAREGFEVPRDMQERPRVKPYRPDPSLAEPPQEPTAVPRWNPPGS